MGGRNSSFNSRKSSGGAMPSEGKKVTQQQNENHSWVQTPPGVDQPMTSTYERFEKRNARYWDQKWREHVAEEERIEAAKSPAQKRQEKNLSLESVARHREKVNKIKRRINARGGALDLNGKRTQVPMMPMPELRHLSREEINKVKKNIRRKKE